MKKAVALPWVFLALASLITAGCGNKYNQIAANAFATPTPFPVATATCTPPPGETIQMVFPQNGSIAAANLQGVVIAVGPSPLPTNWYVYATSQFGTTAGTTSIGFLGTPVPVPGSPTGSTPTPLPVPSDTPLIASPIFETASLGTFANNTLFTVFIANSSCFPGIQGSTFTTTLTDSPTPTPTPTST